MRISREIVGIGILLLLFVGAAVVMTARDTSKSRIVGQEGTPDPSIYNDRASGSKGLFEFVRESGYTPTVWRRRWAALETSDSQVLISVAPSAEAPKQMTGGDDSSDDESSVHLTSSDATALLNWLKPGRTAVVLSSELLTGHTSSSDDDSFSDTLGLSIQKATAGQSVTQFTAVQPTPLAHGVLTLDFRSGARIQSTAPEVAGLFGDRNGSVVSMMPVGKGRLIVIADDAFASNRALGCSENAVFIGNLLGRYARPGAKVLFDEFHHGDADIEGGGSVWGALGRPLQLTIVQLLLGMLVAFVVASSRFGTPVPLFRQGDRTSAEYVTSLANLYWKAGASTTALEMIYKQFLRELTSRLGLSADVNLETLADVAARRGGVGVMEMRRLLTLCEQHIDSGKVSEVELLDLVRRMDRIRKDIGIA